MASHDERAPIEVDDQQKNSIICEPVSREAVTVIYGWLSDILSCRPCYLY
jgi:hypothetical protein